MNELRATDQHRSVGRPRRRTASVVCALLVLVVGVVAAGPGTVRAHAQLLTVSPADGETVGAPPTEVILTFNESVSLTGGDVRVLDDSATQVSADAVQSGVTIAVPLAADLANGTYTVTWQVVSADSHRITGASVFHVGAASSAGLDVGALEGGTGASGGVRAGAVVLSAVAYAAAIIAVGAWCFTTLVERRRGRAGSSPLEPLIVRSAVMSAVMLVGAVPFRIARVGGGLDALRDNEVLAAELGGPIGQSVIVAALGLLAFAVVVERRWPASIAGAVAVVALSGFSLEGHTRALDLRAVMIASDVVHLSAAAVWVGGIVGLTAAFRTIDRADPLARLVTRFSNVALVAVLVVSASGVLMAWIVLPSVGKLTSTGYGLALIVKVALVLVVIGLGAFNRWLLVPAVAARGAGGRPSARPAARSLGSAAADAVDEGDSSGAKRTLLRIMLTELVILLAVILTTAMLVTRSPVGSTSAAALPATTVATQLLELELSDGVGTVELSLTPGRVGTNVVDLVLRDDEGRIVNPVDSPVVEFTQPVVDIGPLRPDVTALDIGRYQLSAQLAVAGDWELIVRVRISDFASATASAVVTIA